MLYTLDRASAHRGRERTRHGRWAIAAARRCGHSLLVASITCPTVARLPEGEASRVGRKDPEGAPSFTETSAARLADPAPPLLKAAGGGNLATFAYFLAL